MDVNIVKLLYTYGPFALLVFFVYVIEGKVRGVLKDPAIPGKVGFPIYCATWAVIFGLCGGVVYIWVLFNVSSEATIRGTFENIQSTQSVASRFEMYLRRYYTKGDSFDYDWRLVTPHRLAEGTQIDFDFASSPFAIATRHVITIHDSFYQYPVAIRYLTKAQKLVLYHDGKNEDLPPVDDVGRGGPAPKVPMFQVVSSVFAAQSASAATVYQRLNSTDPVIRRVARDEVASRGKAELPQIEKILLSDSSSYALRVGAISANNSMKGIDGDSLSQAAYVAIVRAAFDEDPSLSAEAFRFFKRFSVAGSMELPSDLGGGVSRSGSMKVKALDPKNGDFTFYFTISPQEPGKGLLELNEIDVFEDSSAGTTQWIFGVLAGQQEAFRIPNRRYGDNPTPMKYKMTPSDKASASIRLEPGEVKISVIGYKPKNLPRPSTQKALK